MPLNLNPESARERSDKSIRARAPHLALVSRRHRLTSLNNERGRGVYCHRRGEVKALRICADKSMRSPGAFSSPRAALQ